MTYITTLYKQEEICSVWEHYNFKALLKFLELVDLQELKAITQIIGQDGNLREEICWNDISGERG